MKSAGFLSMMALVAVVNAVGWIVLAIPLYIRDCLIESGKLQKFLERKGWGGE